VAEWLPHGAVLALQLAAPMRTALFLVAVMAAIVPTAGCSFNVRGSDPAAGLGGVGDVADDPALESPGSPGSPPPSAMADMTVVAAAPDRAPPPDLAHPSPLQTGVGAPCANDQVCGGNGLVCVKHVGGLGVFGADFPGGYCSRACDDDTACPAGSVCQTMKGAKICLADCPPANCRSGYTCCAAELHACTPSPVCSD
jgi:hypothetical protein